MIGIKSFHLFFIFMSILLSGWYGYFEITTPSNPGVLSTLLSIKTGSCPENCKYCPQSAHYNVDLKKENLIELSRVKKALKDLL